ncbi:VWA domain-containing protein [Lentisalinibacter sediminis]|uniref:VWA domain-containing protein n=1 Tax=Lentisalinibacter sediminis TaxID=2992237 RepID=UPI003862EC61
MPAEFHFLRPLWLLAIPAVLALAWWLASRRLDAGSWRAIIDERLRPYVLDDRGATARGRGPYWLAAAIGVLASVALSGPAWERQKQELYRGGDSLVVALDLSRSMDAADVAPSRLARARLKLLDLLERRQEGQTALIVYSAHAFTVTPLTDDVDTIAALVGSLSTDIMPSRGSVPARALAKARELLEQAGASRGHVLLIGDGAAGEPVSAAATLRDAGYRVSVLGVGTAEGGPLPKPDGGFVTDPSGRMVLPALEESLLQEIAIAGGGIYRRLSVDDGDLEAVLAAMGPGAPGTRADDGREFFTELWHDRGPWLVLALLPLAALAFRRGWVLVLVVLAMPLPQPARAAEWQDLWLTPNQQAARALEEGRAGEAAELFEDPAWEASARYRAGDYAASAEAFAGLDTVDAAYNRGNALARQGEFEAAIQAYEQALAAEPDHEDARYNRDLLRQLQQQQQQQPGGEGESGDGQDGQQSEDGQQQSAENQQQSGEEGESAAGQDDEQEGEQGADGSRQAEADGQSSPADAEEQQAIEELREEMRRAAEAAEAEEGGEQRSRRMAAASGDERSRQEQMQAMEQWLRRVPNDPGGLLRRKFRDQYQREGRDQDGNPLWAEQEEVQPW